jgi:hypothetical protein
MMRKGMLEAARPGRGRKLGTGVRVLGLLVLGCSAASATALLYPGRGPAPESARVAPRLTKVSLASALSPGKEDGRIGAATAPTAETRIVAVPPQASQPAAPAAGSVRQIPLSGGVDPTPPTPPKTIQAAVQPAPAPAMAAPPPSVAAQAPAVLATNSKVPTTCLAPGLHQVLQDVQARFGPVTLVSTTELHTDNHAKGSVRHKLHGSCQAVDFKVEGDLNPVTAYLRTRTEVAGINTYKNNRVIHIDAAQPRSVAQR